jgi:hypothetical protein
VGGFAWWSWAASSPSPDSGSGRPFRDSSLVEQKLHGLPFCCRWGWPLLGAMAKPLGLSKTTNVEHRTPSVCAGSMPATLFVAEEGSHVGEDVGHAGRTHRGTSFLLNEKPHPRTWTSEGSLAGLAVRFTSVQHTTYLTIVIHSTLANQLLPDTLRYQPTGINYPQGDTN